MEKIKNFLKVDCGYGYGDGSEYVYGNGCGSGWGDGHGHGNGGGDGGYGKGLGSGGGDVIYCGCGYGYSYGLGNNDGTGKGKGSNCDIGTINGMTVASIDGIYTAIKSVVGNMAKGFIVNDDLTLEPCYVAKGNNLFAHGETAEEALLALQEKIFENMNSKEAIDEFLKVFDLGKKYPAKDFYYWHHILTGSCKMGRDEFIKSHEIDLENGLYTVKDFIEITKNSYGGEVIRQLEEEIVRRKNG